MNICVFGLGNFGYAITKHLSEHSDKSYSLFAFDTNDLVRNTLIKTRKHPKLHKNKVLRKNVTILHSQKELIEIADVLILAIPSQAISEVINNNKNYFKKGVIIVNTAKALVEGLTPISEQVLKILPSADYKYAILAGGTIATDLFHKNPLGVDIASKDLKTAKQLVAIFNSKNLNAYPLTDVKGVELASSFKNVAAIFAGIIYGKKFSYGSETHIISLVAKELEDLAISMGAKSSTFRIERQCWGNDLFMSCTGKTRNREFGIIIGEGTKASKALKLLLDAGKTVEGANTVKALNGVANSHNYPLLYSLTQVVNNDMDSDIILETLSKLGGN